MKLSLNLKSPKNECSAILSRNDKNQELIKILMKNNIHNNKLELKSVLYLVLKISNNHQPHPNFFNKIERVLTLLQDDITKFTQI